MKIKIVLFVLLLLLFTLISSSSTYAQETENKMPLIDNQYNIEIIASQWQFQGIDLNSVQEQVSDGMSDSDARETATYFESMGLFETGKSINFVLYSIDVQHGFSLVAYSGTNETIVVQEAMNRPLPDQPRSIPVEVSIQIPENAEKLAIECHIFCGLGHPDMKFDLLLINTYTSTTLDFNFGVLLVVGLAGLSVLSFGVLSARSKILANPPKLSTEQASIISNLFQNRTPLYFYMFNQVSNEGITDENKHEIIPQDILKHKFLLHPVRLSMMKLLYENVNLTSNEIKTTLNISWNDVGNHLNALKEKGFITLEHQLHNDGRKLVATIEPFGSEQFKILTELLHVFLDSTVDFEIPI